MAQDLTTRVQVLGQNPDGSLNVSMSGNPFNPAAQNMMQPAAPAGGTPGAYRAMINNVEVAFASEADMLKAKLALQNMTPGGNALPQLVPGASGGTGGGGTGNWLGLAANAGSAINNLFVRSNLDRKVKDYDRALAAHRAAQSRLDALTSKYPDLIPVLQDLIVAERAATETAQATLEDMVAANGVAIGVDVARVATDFLATNNQPSLFSSGGGGSGAGTALLAGGVGLGVGLLASRSSNNSR